MKQEFRFIIFWITIIFNLSQAGYLIAQDYSQTLKFADEKFAEGNYELALKAYQRLAFFSEASEPSLFIKVAEIGAIQKEYELAQKYYGFAISQIYNDSFRTELIFEKAYYQMLDGNYQYAIIDLLSIDDSDEKLKDRVNLYLGTCYFGLEDFERSKMYFKASVLPEFHDDIDGLYARKRLFSPSPSTAKVLSIIFPGAGQFYSGYVKDGLNSFLLTAGLVAVFVNSVNSYSIWYALVSVMPWIQRYYTGGFTRAEKLAKLKRQNKRNRVYNEVLYLIGSKE
jgi:tetratricopeptide (TPR) repeat protein